MNCVRLQSVSFAGSGRALSACHGALDGDKSPCDPGRACAYPETLHLCLGSSGLRGPSKAQSDQEFSRACPISWVVNIKLQHTAFTLLTQPVHKVKVSSTCATAPQGEIRGGLQLSATAAPHPEFTSQPLVPQGLRVGASGRVPGRTRNVKGKAGAAPTMGIGTHRGGGTAVGFRLHRNLGAPGSMSLARLEDTELGLASYGITPARL